MVKILKGIGIALASLIGLIVLVAVGLLIYGQVKFKPVLRSRPLLEIKADTSPEGQARGKYLMEAVTGCSGACHTGETQPFVGMVENINQGPISGVIAMPNLTPDRDTGLGTWTDAEIARAIREGVDREGRGLVLMPAYNYHVLSDTDVAAMIGYLRNLEPVRNEIPPFQLNAPAKVLLALGMFGPDTVGSAIEEPQVAPQPGTTEYGGYLVSLGACRDCHMQDLAGGAIPFSEPGAPEAPNLTPGGELANWSEADFLKAIRNGLTPDGQNLDPEAMPWPEYGKMTDADLAAIFMYLQALPEVQK
jgi:mono/diheme cytochrome c family protein